MLSVVVFVNHGTPPRVRTQAGEWYTPKHPELFEAGAPRREWLQASFLAAVEASEWTSELRSIISKEHPDAEVYSFPFLTPQFASMLLGEARHYAASGLSNPKPNGMNNYGIKWEHIGLGGLFERIRQRYVGRVASVLFPHLGGDTLDHQHSYLVHYDTESGQGGLSDEAHRHLNHTSEQPREPNITL